MCARKQCVGNGLLDVRHMFIELRLAAVQIFVIVVESLKSLKRLSSKRRRRRLLVVFFCSLLRYCDEF